MPATGSDDLDGRASCRPRSTDTSSCPTASIRLTFEDGSLSINAGCNTMFGAYTVDGDVLSAPTLAMTEMACDPALMEQDTWISGRSSRAIRRSRSTATR